MTTNEQLHRIDSDIARYQGKVKALQNKIMQLGEKKKKLQERALLEAESGTAKKQHGRQGRRCGP